MRRFGSRSEGVEKRVIAGRPAIDRRQRSQCRTASPEPQTVDHSLRILGPRAIHGMFEQPHLDFTHWPAQARGGVTARQMILDSSVEDFLGILGRYLEGVI